VVGVWTLSGALDGAGRSNSCWLYVRRASFGIIQRCGNTLLHVWRRRRSVPSPEKLRSPLLRANLGHGGDRVSPVRRRAGDAATSRSFLSASTRNQAPGRVTTARHFCGEGSCRGQPQKNMNGSSPASWRRAKFHLYLSARLVCASLLPSAA